MKKLSLFISAFALFAVSCSTEDVQDVAAASTTNTIGFIANTTRGSIITLDDMTSTTDGFAVYATNGNEPTAWNSDIDGTNNYAYDGGWSWSGTDAEWPDDSADYPMNFYAYYPDTDGIVSATAPDNVTLSITAANELTSQIDYLAATAEADARPTGDKLALSFEHILSKVNFAIVPGYETMVYIPRVGTVATGSNGSYEVVSGTWSSADSPATDDFDLLSYDDEVMTFTGSDASETTAQTIKANEYLMMVPQTTTSWTPTSGVDPSESYALVLYRITDTDGTDLIGYTTANDHPDYDSDNDSAYDGKALFVMVGYPLGANSYTWDMGKAYLYKINLGTDGASNGYLLDDSYYDEDGNDTDLTIDDKEPGDPVSDGNIDFTVTVGDWGDETSTDLE